MVRKGKISIFHGKGSDFELKEFGLPELKPGEILVKNEFTTLCRSDLHTYSGKRIEKTPTILGHEIVGRIEAFGLTSSSIDERGNQLKENDLITWAIYASDPESRMAKRGIPQKGEDLFKYGHEKVTPDNNFHGGLSQFTILRPNTPVIKVAEHVPLPSIALINCAVATAAGALRLAGDLKDKIVMVSGAGMLGLVACAMCRSYGAGQVIAVDPDPARLKVVNRFGTDQAFLAGNNLYAQMRKYFGQHHVVDVVLEFSGQNSAMQDTLEMLDIGGIAVWIGATYPQEKLAMYAEMIIRKLITIKGLHNYNNHDLVAAVEFIEKSNHVYHFEDLVQGNFSLDQVNEAFAYAINQNPFRVGIDVKNT